MPKGYTDPILWETAVDDLKYLPDGYVILTEDFESSPVGQLPAGTTDIGLFDMVLANTTIFNSIAFTASTTEVNVDLNDNGGTTGAARIDWVNFDVPLWIHGIGFDVSSLDADLTITVNGVDVVFAGNNPSFVGIVEREPIFSLTFTADNVNFILDNVLVAIREVPEPAGLALFGLGLLGLGATRRRLPHR